VPTCDMTRARRERTRIEARRKVTET